MTTAFPDLRLQPYAFAWRDGAGPVNFGLGQNSDEVNSSQSLSFQNFHFPIEAGGIWSGFPTKGHLVPENALEIAELAPTPLTSFSLGEPDEFPGPAGWRDLCRSVEEYIELGKILKAVPARKRSYVLSAPSAKRLQGELLPRLFSGQPDGTFRFLLKWQSSWFFGASPEMLFRRERDQILVPAIAGTRPSNLEEELLHSSKERDEHALVVQGIRESLMSLGLDPQAPDTPILLRIRGLTHLYTPVSCRDSGVAAEKLIDALHPTPAVGGYPRKPAAELLLRNEPQPRGLFASPMLFRHRGSEFCLVAIRSGLLHQNTLHLFAGAGYVKGSNQQAEWDETGKKMDFLRRLLEEERA